MVFKLSEKSVRRLCEINNFPIADGKMHFFGFRGCLPVDTDTSNFASEHDVRLAENDYIHPRCTIGQWLPKEGKIALFCGSTVPHIRYVKASKERNGLGANQLMTGFYKDYRKGVHKPGSPAGHPAFRQTEARPIRRTADDFDFDNDDRVEFMNPYDNIHAAWCMGINHDEYSSAGCQVIVGFPACEKRGENPDAGHWKVFKEKAYALDQERFPYILLNGTDAYRTSLNPSARTPARIRFGSEGGLVEQVQQVLKQKRFYEGKPDGLCGNRTIRAILDFQTAVFGPNADDGVVGPVTASALGLSWPSV